MLAAQRGKGRLRNAKGESFSPQQLQAAQEDYEEEATLFLLRLKSLKKGQSRSLLTQAARHHASQVVFQTSDAIIVITRRIDPICSLYIS